MGRGKERLCIGCGLRAEGEALTRVVLHPDTRQVVIDWKSGLGGRGASLHPARACVERACRSPQPWQKAFRTAIRPNVDEVLEAMVEAHERRLHGLLHAARGARKLTFGHDETMRSAKNDALHALILAEDLAKKNEWLTLARSVGMESVLFDSKQALGLFFRRQDVGVIGVLDPHVAAELMNIKNILLSLTGESS